MEKRLLAVAILTLLSANAIIGVFEIYPARAAGTIYIRPDGSIEPPYAPISNVGNAYYTFTADINNQPIVVQRDNIVVDGGNHMLQGNGTGTGITLTSRNNVTVTSMTIKTFENGILLQSDIITGHNTITENKILNNTKGVNLLWRSYDNTISKNNIANNTYGVYSDSTSRNSIFGNSVTNNSYGLFLDDFWNGKISENSIINNGYGLELYWRGLNDTIIENYVANNNIGIWIEGGENNTIARNNITNNSGSGLYIRSSNDKIIGNNLTSNGGAGIYFYPSSSNSSIIANNIAKNLQGVSVYQTLNMHLYRNNFQNNTKQVESSGTNNSWNKGEEGNYWSDYKGNDTNHDGIGETPYVIDANNVDHYPLIVPWNPTLSVLNVTTWHWTSNTTINSVAVGDVDGDGQEETLTGGAFYDGTRNVAQLVVWNSSSLIPEQLTTWYWVGNTTINSVALGDVDGDGQTEIVTGGTYYDGVRNVAQLVVWSGPNLEVKRLRTWYWNSNTVINSVAIGDVDADSQVEIVTGGYYFDGTRNIAQLVVWNGATLAPPIRVLSWYWTGKTVINSVAIGDVDADGQVEIVTGGSYFDDTRSVAQLIVWTGSSLAVKRLTNWYWHGDTSINSVAVGDVDGDGQTEILTGGYYFDGSKDVAQLVVWAGSNLTVDRLTYWYWTGNTVITSVALGDVDGDGRVEIVTGGYFYDGTRNVAQLVVWSGSSLTLKYIRTWYWVSDTLINSVCLSDINSDFSAEIVTGGAYYDELRSSAQIVVWGMKQTV